MCYRDFFLKNPLSIAIYHNILWSKYKGVVFSNLYECSRECELNVRFFQIAETERDRVGLSGVDLSYHAYPFNLIFQGAYDDVPVWQRISTLFKAVYFGYKYDFLILPGYHKLEYWAMLVAAILRRIPRSVFCDSTANDRPYNLLKSLAKRLFFSCCHGFFCYGERSRQYLLMHGAPADRIFHRVQAAALPAAYEQSKALPQRIESQRKLKDYTFIYVGRLSPEKDLLNMLRAFSLVLKSRNDVRLNIIGSGPQRSEIESYITEKFLPGEVQLLGGMAADALAVHYLSATALILPSTSEPWGLVVNEAMSYGCPVIVSDVCGCSPELVIDYRTGFSFRTGDVIDMAEKIKLLLSSEINREEMSRVCIDVISDFTPRHAAMQIIHGVKAVMEKIK